MEFIRPSDRWEVEAFDYKCLWWGLKSKYQHSKLNNVAQCSIKYRSILPSQKGKGVPRRGGRRRADRVFLVEGGDEKAFVSWVEETVTL